MDTDTKVLALDLFTSLHLTHPAGYSLTTQPTSLNA